MERSLFVGIDVANKHLDVHAVPTDTAVRVTHDAAGLATSASGWGRGRGR